MGIYAVMRLTFSFDPYNIYRDCSRGVYPGEAKMCLRLGIRLSSAYTRRFRRLFLARSHVVQPSKSAAVFLFVNTVRSSRLQLSTVHVGVYGTVSCRTALTRRHWTFYVCTL